MLIRQPTSRILLSLGLVLFLTLLFYQAPRSSGVFQSLRRDDTHLQTLLNDINNRTLGFEKIFVVGLPSRTDRRDGMTLQASVGDLDIDFIDGVHGDSLPDNAVPTTQNHPRPGSGVLGAWRAHMNAAREIVRRNLTSALILEDDVDWDVRLKQQLRGFALSTQSLIQPLAGLPESFADPTYPAPADNPPKDVKDISFSDLPRVITPSISPYGDNWDVLWLGHCGIQFPYDNITPRGRVVHTDDITVAEKRYLWSFVNPFRLVDEYPEHTRIVHHAQEGVCTLGYALSQQGARRLLKDVALREVSDAYDILLRFFCDGLKGRKKHQCLTVQPGLFYHHRPAGPNSANSDIGNHGDGFREQPMTDAVRWSTRINADVLIDGGTVFHDGYPDSD